MNLTAQSIAGLKLKAGETDRIWFDEAVSGFGLRLREGGSRVWIFQYKIGQKQRRLVIGQATAIKPARAREIAGEYHAKVKLGRDPAAEKRVRTERAGHTFGALVRKYLDYQKSNIRPRSYDEIERHLEAHAKPLHALPVDTIDKRTIADRLNTIEKNSGAVAANRVRASLSAMFGWAMREDHAGANPVMNTNKRKEQPRERVLTDAELRAIWMALEPNQYGTIVKLLTLTGQRLNEIAGLRWSEIDFARGVISLPAERTKNGRPHEVPMGEEARSLIEAQAKTAERDLVFGRGDGPFSGWSRCKDALDERLTKANGKPLAHWTLHDLRRTAATRMADLGIPPHVIEAILNHVSGHKGGIAGIYNRALYTAEKAQALALWGDHLSSLVAGRRSNVTTLKRA